jgi:hypothetical protein
MKRIIIVCEGETEQEFCKTILYPYFIRKGYYIQPPLIKKTKGGIVKWEVLKNQVENHLKQDLNAYVTTFIDYYGLYQKHAFPNWEESLQIPDKNERMILLEKGMKGDINTHLHHRFIPYMQLHEFEGLLFNDINVFHQLIPEKELIGVEELEKTFRDYDNPEMINDNIETSPSHRLKRIVLGYNKIVYGNIIAETIGLPSIRQKSPRFNNWLRSLENL